MILKVFSSVLLLGGVLFSATDLRAEAPAPERNPMMQQRNGRGPGMDMRRNPDMMTARLVMKELRAYQANPTPENFAALEKALNEAMKKDTAERKANLEKALANLEKDQQQRAKSFLEKVKSGELKMPRRQPRGDRQRGPRGKGGDRPRGSREAKADPQK